jgi:hypothetical protein
MLKYTIQMNKNGPYVAAGTNRIIARGRITLGFDREENLFSIKQCSHIYKPVWLCFFNQFIKNTI